MMELRDYQKAAVEFLRARRGAALWADMGLGKTAIVLSALTPEHLPALVVAPKRVAENVWQEERDLWRPDLSISVAAGTPQARTAALQQECDITVIGRDNFRDVLKTATPWRTLILDEASGFKSKGSVRWKTARKMLARVSNVWEMTGTPSPNGLHDVWAQIYLLDRGERLGTTLGEYRGRYFRSIPMKIGGITVVKYELMPHMDEKIHGLLEDVCLSLSTEGRVDLPPVIHNEIKVTLPPEAVKAYRDLRQDLITNLGLIGGRAYTAANSAVLTTKLSQLTAGFLYDDDHDMNSRVAEIHQEKLNAVVEVVEETGSPVLVFYRFRWEKEALLKVLPQSRTMKSPDVIQDWNRGRVPVLLAHPLSAGHGLNLQRGGHTVVWSSLTWSPEEWEQANKRLHRSGQTHPVVIHRIMAQTPSGSHTVDHVIYDSMTGKATVQSSLLSHLESPL